MQASPSLAALLLLAAVSVSTEPCQWTIEPLPQEVALASMHTRASARVYRHLSYLQRLRLCACAHHSGQAC